MDDFADRVAIVTGAASGVGREVTRQLAGRGASVVAVDISPAISELAADTVVPLEGDTSVASTAERAVEAATGRFGRLDVLVNNSGYIVWKSIVDTSEEEWERVFAVNAKSMFLHCRAAIPVMQAQGGGAIVSTASISGMVGLPQQAAYCASKGAVVQLTRQLAVEYGPAKIRVNAVAPGAIDTPFLRNLVDSVDETIKSVKRMITALRPLVLDDLGITAAIEWQTQEFEERAGIPCDLTIVPANMVIDADRSTAIFRILQETLTNIARHAKAHSVTIILEGSSAEICLTVNDDGVGITETQANDDRSFGLIGIRERAAYWGGRTEIQGANNGGTTIIVHFPLEQGTPS